MTQEKRDDKNPHVSDANNARSHGALVLRERAFFYALVLVLGVLALFLVWPYLSSILLAFAAVVILKPLYKWYFRKPWIQEIPSRATALTIVTALLFIAIPVFLFLSMAANQAAAFFRDLSWEASSFSVDDMVASFGAVVDQLRSGQGLEIHAGAILETVQTTFASIADWLGSLLAIVGQAIPVILVQTAIVLVIVMVLLPRYESPDRGALQQIIPFPETITKLYLDKIHLMIVGIFRGTFVIAFVQGAAMGLVFWLVGVPNVVFLTLVSMLLSILPVVGVSLTAWPVAIILFLKGDLWQGIFVIVMLIGVVGNIDTVLRPVLVPKGAYLNPALILLSVFGGIHLLGLVGAIYGPVIMILLVTSIEVYTKYILRDDLAPYLDQEGGLDLVKLGLQPGRDQQNARIGGLASVLNRWIGNLATQTPPANATDNEADHKL